MKLDGKRIAFLGDSITFGGCLENSEDCYVNRIVKMSRWGRVLTYAVPGSRIGAYIGSDPRCIGPSFVERFRQMEGKLDIVMVFGGTNDFGIGNAPLGDRMDHTPFTFYGALNLLMEGLKEKYPEALLAFMTPLHRRTEAVPNEYSGAVLADYVSAIRERAEEYKIHILDLYAAESLKPDDAYYETMLTPDGIHPNAYGHAVIAEEVIRYLKKEESILCGG